jgi:hypothetical protein
MPRPEHHQRWVKESCEERSSAYPTAGAISKHFKSPVQDQRFLSVHDWVADLLSTSANSNAADHRLDHTQTLHVWTAVPDITAVFCFSIPGYADLSYTVGLEGL